MNACSMLSSICRLKNDPPGSNLGSLSRWVLLAPPGCSWPPRLPLGPPDSPWVLLGPPSSPLAPPWVPWVLLASSGSSWLPVAPPGSSWVLLAPPGSPWVLLAPPGSPWVPLAPPGSYQAPKGSVIRKRIPSGFLGTPRSTWNASTPPWSP